MVKNNSENIGTYLGHAGFNHTEDPSLLPLLSMNSELFESKLD